MLRFSVLTVVLGTVSLIGACYSTGADPDDGSSGGGSSGSVSGGGGGRGGSTSGGSGGSTSRGGATGDPPLGGAPDRGGSGGSTSGGSGGSTTSCVTETRVLDDLVMAGAGGQIDFTICDFTVPGDVDDNYINVLIGGSKLCW